MRILFIFLLFSSVLSAQTIKGYIYDEKENLPLEGAFVYLDGTTFSVTTNAEGFFSITTPQQYNAPLIVTYIGFESFRLPNPYEYDKPVKILLREDVISLNEVVINKGKGLFSRKQMLKVFREQFLGKSKSGKSCTIKNEEDIRIYYDETENKLKATAIKPLRIINKRLKYNMVFDLAAFEVIYNRRTLSDDYLNKSFFAGSVAFTDASNGKPPEKRRKNAYIGSPVHFMKAMASGEWEKEDYQLYIDKWPDDHKKYFGLKDTLNVTKVNVIDIPYSVKKQRAQRKEFREMNGLPDENEDSKYDDIRFTVLHGKKQQSFFVLDKGEFYIDENGLFFPVNGIAFGGYFSELKAGDMLPADYIYME